MKYIILSCLLFPLFAFGQGTVIDAEINSPALGNTLQKVDIYLPPNYDSSDVNTKYQVILFLHGAGGNQDSYSFLIPILNNLITNQTIAPTIVIKPAGNQGTFGSSFYANSVANGNVEDYIIQDVLHYVDSVYNTYGTPNKRAIMGHSMGGIGSMRLGLKYYHLFGGGVAAHSGPLDSEGLNVVRQDIMNEAGSAAPYQYSPLWGVFNALTFAISGAYSPNLSKPIFYVDFPLDSDGNVIDSVHQKWLVENPFNYLKQIPQGTNYPLYFDCGLQDELKIHFMNQMFADSLNSINYPYEYQTYTGGHSDQLATRFPIGLQFLDSVMNPMVNTFDVPLQGDLTQFDIYPNPISSHATIEYEIKTASKVSVEIYNELGQTIKILHNAQQQAGKHLLEWKALQGLANGMYYCKITTKNQVTTKPLVILKK